jgi:hypothetical protein
MMVVVAMAALALGATRWGFKLRRWAHAHALRAGMNRQLETMHLGFEASSLKREQEIEKLRSEFDESRHHIHDPDEPQFAFPSEEHLERLLNTVRENAERSRRRAAHHAALKHKYEHAARFPWRPIEPDPPEPE